MTDPGPIRRRIYLENTQGTAWKFYEIVVHDQAVRLRWGPIGYPGRSLLHFCDTITKARKLAYKKIREKRRRGYQKALEGIRSARTSRPLPVDTRQLPLF